MDDGIQCPRCRTTKYRNPNLTLLVNVCGHSLCEDCVESLFVRGSASCPECNLTLRRANFKTQFFEDSSMDKEIKIRKKILKDFNKKEDDFDNQRDYNDYLEDIEEIIFNLVNDIDIEDTKRRIEAYRKDNKDFIVKNKFKKSEDELLIDRLIEHEKSLRTNYSDERNQELEEKLRREKQQRDLVDDLMFSEAPASDIIKSHAEINQLNSKLNQEKQKEEKLPDKNIATSFGSHTTFMPIPIKKETLYQYQALHLTFHGPNPPSLDDVLHKGYLPNVRKSTPAEIAGGFESYIACMRALQSAVDGLFLTGPDDMQVEDDSSSSQSPTNDEQMQVDSS